MPPNTPYQNPATNRIYELLFCDDIKLYKNDQVAGKYPWNILFSSEKNIDALEKISGDLTLETRPKILALNKLAQNGQKSKNKDLLGVVIEVHLEEGLDVLAAYRDGSARYINHSEKIIIWDTPNDQSKPLTSKLFQEGEIVVQQIGPWEEPRLAPPPPGDVRITLLVSDGLYFGQGPIDVLFNDPKGAPILQAATLLMQYLTENVQGV